MIGLYIFDIIIMVFLIYMFFEFNDKRVKTDQRFADEQYKANQRWTLQVADLQAREMNVRSMFEDGLKAVTANENTMLHYIFDNFCMTKQQIIDSAHGVRADIERNYGYTYEQFDYCRKKLDRIETKLERDKRRRGRRTERRAVGGSGRYFRRLAM